MTKLPDITINVGRGLTVIKFESGNMTRITSPRLYLFFFFIVVIIDTHFRTFPIFYECS